MDAKRATANTAIQKDEPRKSPPVAQETPSHGNGQVAKTPSKDINMSGTATATKPARRATVVIVVVTDQPP